MRVWFQECAMNEDRHIRYTDLRAQLDREILSLLQDNPRKEELWIIVDANNRGQKEAKELLLEARSKEHERAKHRAGLYWEEMNKSFHLACGYSQHADAPVRLASLYVMAQMNENRLQFT